MEGNPIEVYPIEAYLIGKGVVEVSGCSHSQSQNLKFSWRKKKRFVHEINGDVLSKDKRYSLILTRYLISCKVLDAKYVLHV